MLLLMLLLLLLYYCVKHVLCPVLSPQGLSVQIPVGQLHSRGSQATPTCLPYPGEPPQHKYPPPYGTPSGSARHRSVAVTHTDCPRHWGGGSPLPAPPATPSRPRQRAASPALILTPRKVPIAHFQSCFKVTLISKLLAALAGDYSCINQGEIMPVTD